MAAVAQVRTETAYDALQDGLSLVLRLLDGPRDLAALAGAGDRARAQALLGRLVRAGLVREAGGRYEAVANLVHQTRQEGMVTFLSRYVLPLLTRLVREPGEGFVAQLDLDLDPEAQAGLRGGIVQALVEELNALSDEPAEKKAPCTAVVIGTSDVPPASGEASERLLETVRRAARQRATPASRDRAVLTQYDALFGADAARRAEAAVRRAADRLAAARATGQRPGYTIVIGFCVRPDAGEV